MASYIPRTRSGQVAAGKIRIPQTSISRTSALCKSSAIICVRVVLCFQRVGTSPISDLHARVGPSGFLSAFVVNPYASLITETNG